MISLSILLCMDQILFMVESNPSYGQVEHGVIELFSSWMWGWFGPWLQQSIWCENAFIHLYLMPMFLGVIPSAIGVVENVVKSIDVIEMLKIFSNASYVILHSKVGWWKVKICQFNSRIFFWLNMVAKFTMASNVHLHKKM